MAQFDAVNLHNYFGVFDNAALELQVDQFDANAGTFMGQVRSTENSGPPASVLGAVGLGVGPLGAGVATSYFTITFAVTWSSSQQAHYTGAVSALPDGRRFIAGMVSRAQEFHILNRPPVQLLAGPAPFCCTLAPLPLS